MGGLGAILGGLGAVLGRSWAVLGRFGDGLGRSWNALGPLLERNESNNEKKHGNATHTHAHANFKSDFVGDFAECAGPGLTLLSSKNSKTISISIRTRSDPSGGGGFLLNRAARSPQGRV